MRAAQINRTSQEMSGQRKTYTSYRKGNGRGYLKKYKEKSPPNPSRKKSLSMCFLGQSQHCDGVKYYRMGMYLLCREIILLVTASLPWCVTLPQRRWRYGTMRRKKLCTPLEVRGNYFLIQRPPIQNQKWTPCVGQIFRGLKWTAEGWGFHAHSLMGECACMFV